MIIAVFMQAVFCHNPVFARSKHKEQAQSVEKVKAKIAEIGVGKEARVKIKLKDNKNLAGYITRIGNDSFDITDLKTNTTTTVTYSSVKQIKGQGPSERTQNILLVAIVAGILVIVGIVGIGD